MTSKGHSDFKPIHLNEATLEIIRQLASQHGCTVKEFLRALLQAESQSVAGGDPMLGLFADEPDLMDQVVELAYAARKHPLRIPRHEL